MTLAFAAAMAVVLFVVGLLIYVRYKDELNTSIDRELASRETDIVTLLRESDSYNDILPTERERYAQILTRSGRVLDTTARRLGVSSVAPADLTAATSLPTSARSGSIAVLWRLSRKVKFTSSRNSPL